MGLTADLQEKWADGRGLDQCLSICHHYRAPHVGVRLILAVGGEARDYAAQAIRKARKEGNYVEIGYIYREMGETAKARKAYERATLDSSTKAKGLMALAALKDWEDTQAEIDRICY